MITSAVAWLPWLLLTTERGFLGIEAGNGWPAMARWGALFVVALGLMLLAGHLEYSGTCCIWLVCSMASCWHSGHPHPVRQAHGGLTPSKRERGTRSSILGVRQNRAVGCLGGRCFVAGLLLAAPLLLPAGGRRNYRADPSWTGGYEDVVGFALPVTAAALLFPDVFSNFEPSHYFDLTSWRMTPITGSTDAGNARTYPFWERQLYRTSRFHRRARSLSRYTLLRAAARLTFIVGGYLCS
jgi:hypothetical protein